MENRVVGVVRKHEQDYVTRGLYYANQCVISKYRPWYECHNPGDEFWPLPFDIWAVPAVKDLLIEYMESTLHQVQDRRHYPEVPDTVLDSLTLRFKEIANDYSMNSKTELMKLIPDEFKLSSMQETLGLARTLFAKPPDSTITRYPCPPRGRYGWRWCKLASAIMSDIITLAGHDPNAMAFPQLLEEDIWVECLTCAQPDQGTKAKVFVAMDAFTVIKVTASTRSPTKKQCDGGF
ncbi:uncharacterized protein EI90DRAFT_1880387 [Cantharellus anzutake]|uniref:uncharacterized protein n=1 Tax=Cantharellus anzutake TaxID=1750568 RepID=UPI0019071ED2|nr:uncharacterized protein EI90DRAFT_1880387 [Cantharellus anzutake]KAF8326856.1 hypothetical protein EI90DRAFT_1880387 [Cantharellus anzutake]